MTNFCSEEIKKKVFNNQNEWATNIVKIGRAYLDNQNYIKMTEEFLDKLYLFEKGKILFKPTKAKEKQFRVNKAEFMSYFIGYNKVSDEDKGFVLEPWEKVHFENFDIVSYEDIIISMGNYFFINYKDEKIKAEYSFGYCFDINKNLKIIFHHSSLPYNG